MQYILAHKYLAASVTFAHCIVFKGANSIAEDTEISPEVDMPGSYEMSHK